jgi:membrane protease YdiL (CAAX protease family)
MLAFLAVATAPLVEEMIYRGLLYSALQRVTGRLFAVLIVAGMFAGLHVFQYRQNIGAILSIAILSLSLTALRAKTGRLLPCYVIHLIFNGVQSLIIVFYPYLNSLVESSRTGAAKGAVTCIFRCLG